MTYRDLRLTPLPLDEANAFVEQYHRHHPPVRGFKFAVGVESLGVVVGAAIAGRPVSRELDNGLTLEITRVATDGTKNASSMLYGACARAGLALGYRKVITYNLKSESGISLRAAGFKVVAEVRGRSWDTPSRPRVDKHPLQNKLRWEVSA